MLFSGLKASPRLCLALNDLCVGIVMTFPVVIMTCLFFSKDTNFVSYVVVTIVVHAILMFRHVIREAQSIPRLIYLNEWKSISISVLFAGIGMGIALLHIGPILKNPLLNVVCFLITTLTAISTMCICNFVFYTQKPVERAKWVTKQLEKLQNSSLILRSELVNANIMVETLFIYLKAIYLANKQQDMLRQLNKIPSAGKLIHIKNDPEGFLNRLKNRLDSMLQTLEK